MDPNATLARIYALMADLRQPDQDSTALGETALELVDAVEALDDWLRRGGFLPDEWRLDK